MSLGCPSRKIPYSSRGEARTMLKKMRHGVKGMEVYLCHCGFWHHGHPKRKGAK